MPVGRGPPLNEFKSTTLRLRGAFAAAELEGEGLIVAPILVDLREEVGGLGEVRGERAEGFHFVADHVLAEGFAGAAVRDEVIEDAGNGLGDRKSTRLNSSHRC